MDQGHLPNHVDSTAQQRRERRGREVGFAVLYVPLGLVPVGLVASSIDLAHLSERGILVLGLAGISSMAILGVIYTLYRQKLEIERQNIVLARMSATDPLTGLGNRRALWEKLAEAVALAERRAAPICIMAMDLDRFKELNDALGHAKGDQALELVAAALRNATRRDQDDLFRTGGDEFVVLMPETSLEGAERVALRISNVVASSARERFNGLSLGCSMGIAAHAPGEPVEAWLHRADEAMYLAKRGHLGLQRAADPELAPRTERRRTAQR